MIIGNIEIDDAKIKSYIKKVDEDENLISKTQYEIEDEGKIYHAVQEIKNKKEIGFSIDYKEIKISGGTLKDNFNDIFERQK